MKKLFRKYLKLVSKINERHYWPLFIFLSLYFVVPYSEFVVTAFILLYFKFEKVFRNLGGKITSVLPEWLRIGGSIIFFLVMLDDTLMYLTVIGVAYWSSRQAKKLNQKD
jgi:hypothetical protein